MGRRVFLPKMAAEKDDFFDNQAAMEEDAAGGEDEECEETLPEVEALVKLGVKGQLQPAEPLTPKVPVARGSNTGVHSKMGKFANQAAHRARSVSKKERESEKASEVDFEALITSAVEKASVSAATAAADAVGDKIQTFLRQVIEGQDKKFDLKFAEIEETRKVEMEEVKSSILALKSQSAALQSEMAAFRRSATTASSVSGGSQGTATGSSKFFSSELFSPLQFMSRVLSLIMTRKWGVSLIRQPKNGWDRFWLRLERLLSLTRRRL